MTGKPVRKRPVVGIPCDIKTIGALAFHAVGAKYVEAVRGVVGALPLLIPVIRDPLDVEEILGLVGGLFLTGSASNVHPERYGGPEPNGFALDRQRDATTLQLIPAAIARDMPLFAICRGMQELNVALGGTLDPALQDLAGRIDHREDEDASEAVRYGPAHDIEATEGGLLERLAGKRRFQVNSLHAQGIARLAPGLKIEALAHDGTIEAVSHERARFLLGVQWHPEWRARDNPISVKLLEAFGTALAARS
jgi:putative glutamine amidotransferase